MPISGLTGNQAPVSFTLDQVKSLLHYSDKKGFATSADKTNGTFKLDGKGNLTNVNRFRYLRKSRESDGSQSLQIRQALYKAFSDKTADAAFLKTVRTTLGLSDDLNSDSEKIVDGNILSNTPLARRDVKKLILSFKKVQEGELEASGESFKKNLKESLGQLIGSEQREFMSSTVQLLKRKVDDALDSYVYQFVEEMNKAGRVPLASLKKLALDFYATIYSPDMLITGLLDNGGRENWKSVIGAALIKFADQFGCKKELTEYLENDLNWDFGEQVNLQQDDSAL